METDASHCRRKEGREERQFDELLTEFVERIDPLFASNYESNLLLFRFILITLHKK